MTDGAPACWNRAPRALRRWRSLPDGGAVMLSNDWFEDRCATWDGTGIGQPTPQYPSGTPYPVAHGWAPHCLTCRWCPDSALDAARAAAQHTRLTPTLEPA